MSVSREKWYHYQFDVLNTYIHTAYIFISIMNLLLILKVILCAAALCKTLQAKLSNSMPCSHNVLTLGYPVLALTL